MPNNDWFKQNPKVSAYLSPDLYERLEAWMKTRNIKKVSQGLTTILEEYLGVVQKTEVDQIELIELPTAENDRIEALRKQIETLSSSFEKRFEVLAHAIDSIKKTGNSTQPAGSPTVNQSSASQLSIPVDPQNEQTDQSSPKHTEIWTTKDISEKLGVDRRKLERYKNDGKFPYAIQGHTILGFAGKQDKSPFSSLWKVQRLD